jgi:hypothetical protein
VCISYQDGFPVGNQEIVFRSHFARDVLKAAGRVGRASVQTKAFCGIQPVHHFAADLPVVGAEIGVGGGAAGTGVGIGDSAVVPGSSGPKGPELLSTFTNR